MTRDIVEIVPNKDAIGRAFKKEAKGITDKFSKLTGCSSQCFKSNMLIRERLKIKNISWDWCFRFNEIGSFWHQA